MIHALLDTNVILDVLLDRTPWSTDAVALWQAKLDRRFVACVTATSLTDIFYIIRRYAGREKAWQAVHSCLDQLSVIPVGIDELRLATTLDGNDFEDNWSIKGGRDLEQAKIWFEEVIVNSGKNDTFYRQIAEARKNQIINRVK